MEPIPKKRTTKREADSTSQTRSARTNPQTDGTNASAIDLQVRPVLNFDRRGVQADGTWVSIDYSRKILREGRTGTLVEKAGKTLADEKRKR